MFLDTDNDAEVLIDHGATAVKAAVPLYAPWLHFPHTGIAHHGAACCDAAKAWFLSMDFSQLNGSPLTGPRWIRARWDWGPTVHPIHWCEAVRKKGLDCGALAALANECFDARGIRSFPAQFVQQYSADATVHWAGKWAAEDTSVHWIGRDVIYHEGCAVLGDDGSIRLWDASAAWWMNPMQPAGYGSLAAVRICVPAAAEKDFRWGELRIQSNVWTTL